MHFKNIYKNINLFLILTLLIFTYILSYRLLDVPMGITVDETALGYNAVLLSRTGHDENGRFLPLFVLSNDGNDWKQPVTQYYLAFLYKIFQPSIFLLRFSSVLISLISSYLLYIFAREIFNKYFALFAVFVFLTTPLIMIQSHMGLDNIMPIPFAIIWIYSLFLYKKNTQLRYLIISAISLGISFYTYKGMRAVFPVWYLLSAIYIFENNLKKYVKPIFIFSIFSLPFFLITPLLNHYYPGAIFGGARPKFDSIYNFLYPYFSSYDLTFLFIKGDDLLIHSTGYHGFFLLASLPLFLVGIYHSLKTDRLSRFLLIIFFTTPILYGTVNSVHRASRLMCLIPFYSIICTYGLYFLIKLKHTYKYFILITIFVLSILNYTDFLNYYYSDYAKLTQSVVGDMKYYLSFKRLSELSVQKGLAPYVASDVSHKYFEALYFNQPINIIHQDLAPPIGSILLTSRNQIDGMVNLNQKLKYNHIQINSSDNYDSK